ncbi:MAG: Ferrienterobactin receptor precursor [Alphaproteobacteria bacterium ADurb.BinA280]|jgi:iron complex outermembrane receptor protein|nr:MAG: Ferrienterobactin receptor precursor [Alphaproteobacteria bacterium ADurb.BinA280]
MFNRKLHPLSAVIALTLLNANAVQAQEKDQAAELDTVVVTGTRSANRTLAESLSPIDLLSADTLNNSGTPELNQALSRLLPSFNFPRPSITDGTDHVRPAQLRGMSPDQVLVLVNGKRRHTSAVVNLNGSQGRGSAAVDLNAIPFYAIDRIEVLRDGASALYGSDAIAGVINIVLKGGDEGGTVETRYGQMSAGDGELIQAGADMGVKLNADGWIHLSAEYRDRADTNRSRPDLRTLQTPATYATVNHRFGDADTNDQIFFFNGQVGLPAEAELYFFGNLGDREGDAAGFYRRAFDSRNVVAIYPDGFLPIINSVAEDTSVVMGVRGDTEGGWTWDVSANYGANDFDFIITNSLNNSLGAASPTEFFAGTLHSAQNLFNADVSKYFDGLIGNGLNVAFGAEHRKDSYRIEPGEEASYVGTGSQVFPGFRPQDSGSFDRDSNAVYLDLESDVTDQFATSLAVRYEDYSDFGSTTSGKLSGRYSFTDTVALRGTVSTGFRAPSLAQQFYATTATNFIGGVPFDVRTFAVTDPVAIALGAEPLQAEESTNVSLGLSLQPTDDLNITIDAYQIDVDDRIILSENLTGTAVQQFLASQGILNANGGRYFTNAIDTRTRGLDIVASYGFTLGDGDLSVTAGVNFNDVDITAIAPNPEELQQGGLQLQRIGRVEQGRVEVGSPDNKLNLGADYSLGNFSLNTNLTRYGEVSVLNTNPDLDQTFGSEWVLDFSASYTLDAWRFTVGADNVLDNYPDEVLFANSTSGILPYSSTSPFGFNGAFWYGKATFRW